MENIAFLTVPEGCIGGYGGSAHGIGGGHTQLVEIWMKAAIPVHSIHEIGRNLKLAGQPVRAQPGKPQSTWMIGSQSQAKAEMATAIRLGIGNQVKHTILKMTELT